MRSERVRGRGPCVVADLRVGRGPCGGVADRIVSGDLHSERATVVAPALDRAWPLDDALPLAPGVSFAVQRDLGPHLVQQVTLGGKQRQISSDDAVHGQGCRLGWLADRGLDVDVRSCQPAAVVVGRRSVHDVAGPGRQPPRPAGVLEGEQPNRGRSQLAGRGWHQTSSSKVRSCKRSAGLRSSSPTNRSRSTAPMRRASDAPSAHLVFAPV